MNFTGDVEKMTHSWQFHCFVFVPHVSTQAVVPRIFVARAAKITGLWISRETILG
jgi:hypothetical protein